MRDENQGWPAGGDPEATPGRDPAKESAPEVTPGPPSPFEYFDTWPPRTPEAREPGFDRLERQRPPGFYPWLAVLTVLGIATLVTRQVETALLIGVAGLFVTAQGADAHPGWRWIHALVAWVPPVAGLFFLSTLAGVLFRSEFPPTTRAAVTVFAGLSASLCLMSFVRLVADVLVSLFFRRATPSHTMRLAARLVLFALLLALPTWFALRGELSSILDEPGTLVSARGLSSSLLGYVILALASVGWLVRRPLREALARLGLTAVHPREWAVIAAGVAALWLFNTGSELVQKNACHALWVADQHFTESLARVMGPSQMVLLGLSAGVGEEITLRGALQPRLGIVLTSLLFAALHVQYSWYGIASIFVFGLILGVIRKRSSTSAAILVHALYDVLALAFART